MQRSDRARTAEPVATDRILEVRDALAGLAVHRHVVDREPVAAIAGEVDISNVDRIAASLTSFSNLALGLVVDLREVDYLDSAAVSLLHDLAMRLRQRAQRLIVVCPPGSPPRDVLELTALTAHTPVLDELAPAIAMLAAPDD